MNLLLLLLMVIFASPAAGGNGSSAHGGDLDRDLYNIWSVGKQKGFYCIKRAKDYHFTKAELSELIAKEVYPAWKKFFQKYGFDKEAFTKFPDGKARKMTLEWEEIADCKDKTQVKFLFGVDAKNQHSAYIDDNFLGTAIPYRYNHKTYVRGGVIWIANWTKDRDKLRHLLLHETGHQFGLKHNSVWVMSEKVAIRLTRKTKKKSPYLGQIENPIWKYQLRDGDRINFTFRGAYDKTLQKHFVDHVHFSTAIIELLKIEWLRKHSMELKFAPAYDVDSPNSPAKTKFFYLTTAVKGGKTHTFKGKFDTLNLRNAGPSIFTKWRKKNKIKWGKRYLSEREFALPASGYFTIGGKKIPALIDNPGGASLRIFSDKDGFWWDTEVYKDHIFRNYRD